jgi:DNA-binding GntR family transcriptional regulator
MVQSNTFGQKEIKLSLRQKVNELIKHDIISCILAPGQQLSESDLAEKYDVSKTPVREALTSLQHDHLVEYSTNRGFMVSSISVKDIHEIYEARENFEGILLRLAIEHINESELNILADTQNVTYDSQDPNSVETYFQANIVFHMTIAEASRNSRLISHYRSLLDEAQRLMYMDMRSTNVMPIWYRSHNKLIEAIRNRDEASGIATLAEIMKNGKRRILGGGEENI